eukprot:366406-Chlamydomonas_euryale.AAC.4
MVCGCAQARLVPPAERSLMHRPVGGGLTPTGTAAALHAALQCTPGPNATDSAPAKMRHGVAIPRHPAGQRLGS